MPKEREKAVAASVDVTFRTQLSDLLNRHSMEAGSDTPDHILARYLTSCLTAFDAAVVERERWCGPDGQERPASTLAGRNPEEDAMREG